MAKKRSDPAEERTFGLLGISEEGERVYRWLLVHPNVTAHEVSKALSLAVGKTRQLLSAIEGKGLVSRTSERPSRYLPVAPDIGLESLILQRQAELQQMRGSVAELQRVITKSPDLSNDKPMMELVSRQEAVRQLYRQVNFLAQRELLCFTRLPLLVSNLSLSAEEDQYEQRQAQVRGLKVRTVVDTNYLEYPLALKRVREDVEAGEEVRVAPGVPLKMTLVDRELAIILQTNGPCLILRCAPLLDALRVLFEVFWEQATPVVKCSEVLLQTATCDSEIPWDVEEILSLLTTGMNDKSIIHELGVSRATFGRRINELMKQLNAASRFQLGWIAAERFSPKIGKEK